MDCTQIEGLLAEAAHETLAERERGQLERHVAECADCATLEREFQELVSAIPVEQPALNTDLLPSLRERIDAAARPARTRSARYWGTGLAAAAAVAFIVLGGMYYNGGADSPQPLASNSGAVSHLDRTFLQTDRLMEAKFYSRAFVVLNEAVERYPTDPRAAEAQQVAADLAFAELHWYPEAHEALAVLRDRYGEQFRAKDENRLRLEVLEESAGDARQYAALHSLDAARTSGEFARYEEVLSRYPGAYIASLAMDELTLALSDAGDAPVDRVLALETLIGDSSNPIALAQLKLELARTLQSRGLNRNRVRQLFEEAASSESLALASAAREALNALGETPERR